MFFDTDPQAGQDSAQPQSTWSINIDSSEVRHGIVILSNDAADAVVKRISMACPDELFLQISVDPALFSDDSQRLYSKGRSHITVRINSSEKYELCHGKTTQEVVSGVLQELSKYCEANSDSEKALKGSAEDISELDFSGVEEWKQAAGSSGAALRAM